MALPVPIWVVLRREFPRLMNVRIRRQYLPWVEDLLRTWYRTSKPLPLGRFAPRLLPYPAYRALVNPEPLPGPVSWNRVKIPIYGSTDINTQFVTVPVPSAVRFNWTNPAVLPRSLPTLKIAPAREQYRKRYALPQPKLELAATVQPLRPRGGVFLPARKRHETTRRRQDSKLSHGYMRTLAFINRTYGEYDEYRQFADAVLQNRGDNLAIATALGINEAVDYAYGARARALKRHIYEKDFYRLPVGIDALSRLWR